MRDFQRELSNIKNYLDSHMPCHLQNSKINTKTTGFTIVFFLKRTALKMKRPFNLKYAVHSPLPLPTKLWVQNEYITAPIKGLDQYW